MDFWFLFKKGLSLFLTPLSITLELVFVGLLLLVFFRGRVSRSGETRSPRARRVVTGMGAGLVALGMALLYLSSTEWVSTRLAWTLEKQHPPYFETEEKIAPGKAPEYFVVLASGQLDVPGKPPLSRLTHAGLARVVGGVDLWRRYPESTIVFTGTPRETKAMRAVAERLGVSPEATVEETASRDTKDHAIYIKEIVGKAPFALVTSATHMPRSLALFRKQGLDPIVAPVDFQTWEGARIAGRARFAGLAPRAIHLQLTSVATHEWLGIWWARLRGQVGGERM